MVMSNQFDLIGDTDIDDPLQIALAQIEIGSKNSVSVASPELPLKETQKGVLAVPRGSAYQGRRGYNGRGRGPGRNFESNRNVDGFSAVPKDNAQELLGKPSIRGHSDQPYRGRGGGRGRGFLNRDNGEYAGLPARRQFERRSGFSSPPAKVRGEPAPLVKDVPVQQVELGTTDEFSEQNLEENATLEGKSLIPKEPVELDNAPSSNALNKDKEGMSNGREEKEPEVKEMTLEEYQKVLEEKRRTLVAMKTQERKVDVDKEFESMQPLLVKKENNEFFIKLGNDKEAGKRKEDADGDERVKKDTERVERVRKSVIMLEFLAEGRGGRGRGRGRGGGRGYSTPSSAESIKSPFSAESIKDARQFPALGGKEVEQHDAAQGKKLEQHSSAQV